MVSFRWGNQNLSLPQSKDYIKSEVKDFISDGDRNFIVKLKRAIESTQSSEDNSELLKIFRLIKDDVLESPLTPFLEQDADGWKRYSQTKARGSKEPKPNTSNINFVKEKTIGDVTEGAVVGRLRGMGAVKYMKGEEVDLPDFDIEEWMDNTRTKFVSSKSVGYDIVIRESEAEGRAGTFNFAHKPSESNLDGHIDALFPIIDEGELTNAKSEYIMEKTGQQATFRTKAGTRQEIAREIIDYSFNIPDEDIEKLTKRGGTSSVLEQTLNEDGEFEPVGGFAGSGVRIKLTTDPKAKLNMQALLTAINDLNRTEQMRNDGIVQIGDKFYSYQLGDADAGTKVKLSYHPNEQGSPFSFLRDNKDIFLRILKPYFSNPLSVYTAEIVGNIKTSKKPKPMFSQRAADVQSKYFKGKSEDRYERVTEWTNKENKEKISPEEYNKLSDEEKEKYTPTVKPLTPSDIKELTDKAFVNMETDQVISENEYNTLPDKEKRKYKSKIIVTEEGKSGGVGLQTFGGTSYDTGSGFQADELQEAFKEAYVDCKIYLKNHGSFNLNPFRQGSPNRSMASHVNKLKKNVRRLRKTLGD